MPTSPIPPLCFFLKDIKKDDIFSIFFFLKKKEIYFFKNSNHKGSTQKGPLAIGQNQLFFPPILIVSL